MKFGRITQNKTLHFKTGTSDTVNIGNERQFVIKSKPSSKNFF